jgi:hypothetical protein
MAKSKKPKKGTRGPGLFGGGGVTKNSKKKKKK